MYNDFKHIIVMDGLKIGLIVVFVCLFIVGVVVVLRLLLCPKSCLFCIKDMEAEGIMRFELSGVSYNDFMHGRLTINLYHEIISLYAIKGNLSAYKQVAKRLGHAYMMEFLKDPARHPMVIHGVFLTGSVTSATAPTAATAPGQPDAEEGAGTGTGLDIKI